MPTNPRQPTQQDVSQQGLANVRALVKWNRENCRPAEVTTSPGTMGSVGVVGAGLMGRAIAAIHVENDVPVVIVDADRQVLAEVEDQITAELATGMPEPEARKLVSRLVRTSERATAIAQCDMVIESIVENLSKKQTLLAELEQHLAANSLLVSNTSTIPITRLASRLDDPSRFCGYHFFHPARRRPLLEIIRGEQTSPRALDVAVDCARAVDKIPIVVKDGPGFLVNRLLMPYMGEGLDLLLEGATIEQVEEAATSFGMAFGPIRLLDEIGLDTALHGGWVLGEAFPDRIVASPLLVAMVKAGRLGRKTSAGFFSYNNSQPHSDSQPHNAPAHETLRIIDQWAGTPRTHSTESITHRLLLPMLIEATRILQQGLVRDARDVDLGLLFGAGFPHCRGGLLYWADELSAARVVQMLKPLQRLGRRGLATPMLLEMANSGGRFYDPPLPKPIS